MWCNTSYPKRRAQMTLRFSSGATFRLGKDTPYLKLVHCFESDIFKPQTDAGNLPKPGTSCYIMQYLGGGSFETHAAACGTSKIIANPHGGVALNEDLWPDVEVIQQMEWEIRFTITRDSSFPWLLARASRGSAGCVISPPLEPINWTLTKTCQSG